MLEETLRRALQTVLEVSVDTGVADATSTVNHLDDIAKDWPVDAFVHLIVEITGGTGEGQIRKIASNTATSLVPVTNFTTAPDATSTYRIGFFGKMASDITAWGGTALTGRDVSLDFKALTDDSIKGLLKSIGDVATLENLITRIGQSSDAIVAAGATGSISAKLRRATQGLEDLKTLIVLAAGTAIIGKVGIDQTTPGTTDRVTTNLDKVSGTALTGRDISLDLAKLDLALTALRDAITAAAPNAKTLNDLYTAIGAIGGTVNRGSFITGQKTITTAGIAEQLLSQAVPNGFTAAVAAKETNTGLVYIGNSKANAENHAVALPLSSGRVITLKITNLNLIWVDAAVNAEGIDYILET